MLYETERTIAENGYKGIFKYLYSGYSEIKKLLLLSPLLFSFLYNDFSEERSKKRMKRIRTVKTVIYTLSLAALAALFYAFSGLLPYSAALIFSLAGAVLSVFIFGVLVHSFNNFLEDKMTSARLTYPLSESELDKLRDKYFISAGERLMEDVTEFVSLKEDAELLFFCPERYAGGFLIKAKMQMLIEILYLRAVETRMKAAQDLLIDFMYGFYKRFDSVILQELMACHPISEDISEKQKREIILFYFAVNDIMFRQGYLKDRLVRIKNQGEMAKLLIIMEKEKEGFSWDTCLDIIEERKYGTISAQLLADYFMFITGFAPLSVFGKYLSSGELDDIKQALSSTFSRSALLKELETKEIPGEISRLYIKSTFSVSDLYDILSDKQNPAEFRLYALFSLSRHSCPSMALKALIFAGADSGESIFQSRHYGTPVIGKALGRELIKESKKYLEDIKSKNPAKGNDFFNAVNAETVFTAMSVIAHKGSKEVDLIDFLRQLKYTFGNGKEVEMIIDLSDGRRSESFSVPLKNAEKYLGALNKVVEEIKVSAGL